MIDRPVGRRNCSSEVVALVKEVGSCQSNSTLDDDEFAYSESDGCGCTLTRSTSINACAVRTERERSATEFSIVRVQDLDQHSRNFCAI